MTCLAGTGLAQLIKPLSVQERKGQPAVRDNSLVRLRNVKSRQIPIPQGAKLVYVNQILKSKNLPTVKSISSLLTLSVAKPVYDNNNYLIYWQPENVFTAVPNQDAVAFFTGNRNVSVEGKSLKASLQIPAPGTYLFALTVITIASGPSEFSFIRNSDGLTQSVRYPETSGKFDVGFLMNFTQAGHQEVTIMSDNAWYFFTMEMSQVK